jgi:hypothetical protein
LAPAYAENSYSGLPARTALIKYDFLSMYAFQAHVLRASAHRLRLPAAAVAVLMCPSRHAITGAALSFRTATGDLPIALHASS